MKTGNAMYVGLLVFLVGTTAGAQHREWESETERDRKRGDEIAAGHHRGDYHRNKPDEKDRYDRNRNDHNQRGVERNERNHYDRHDNRNSAWFNADYRWGGFKRYVTYKHHRHQRPHWAPWYGYNYNTRYIFYEEYNIYYDCHRDRFILWTGRNWVATTRVPQVMARIDFNRSRVSGVDYWEDDFDFYLQRRRPACVTIQAAW